MLSPHIVASKQLSGNEETPRLLWMIDAHYTKGGKPQVVRFGVDAATGDVRHSQQMSFGINRTVYTNAYRTSVATPTSDNLLWVEGNPNPADPHAFSIYERIVHPVQAWSGHPFAYDLLGLVAHHGVSGESWFIYGSDYKPYLFYGDSRAFDDDAIAHEYGHGLFLGNVPNQPSGFQFWDDFFAGNEFYGDLSSVMTDIHRYGVRGNETWAITDLRDWRDPKSKSIFHNDWYPHRYFANPLIGAGYANSTIFGHAVFLMINGGKHRRVGALALSGPIPDITVPAANPDQIKEVLSFGLWLLALNNDKFNGPTFKARTMEAASAVYGPASGVLNTVERAWTAVGIGYDCSAPPTRPVVNVQPQYCRGMHDIFWNQMPNVKYHAQAVTYPWGWDSALTATVVDGTNTSCHQNVSTLTRYRMRACNACGCSDWTPDEWMQYWSPCQ